MVYNWFVNKNVPKFSGVVKLLSSIPSVDEPALYQIYRVPALA